jgi:hypothetical protein
MSKVSIRPMFDLDRIIEIAASASEVPTIFDSSLGIDESCFSAEKLVQLLHRGVTDDDARHLIGCSACSDNIKNLAEITTTSIRDFVANALKVQPKITSVRKDVVSAILALPSKVVSLDRGSSSLNFSCSIFPINCEIEKVDVASITASGAIVTNVMPQTEIVDMNGDGTPDFIKVMFENGILGARVKDAIQHHPAVIDTLEIAADVLCLGVKKRLLGQASLEFVTEGPRRLR